jgi:hypothetical protein
MSEINKNLSETLIRAGCLEGVVSEHGADGGVVGLTDSGG